MSAGPTQILQERWAGQCFPVVACNRLTAGYGIYDDKTKAQHMWANFDFVKGSYMVLGMYKSCLYLSHVIGQLVHTEISYELWDELEWNSWFPDDKSYDYGDPLTFPLAPHDIDICEWNISNFGRVVMKFDTLLWTTFLEPVTSSGQIFSLSNT